MLFAKMNLQNVLPNLNGDTIEAKQFFKDMQANLFSQCAHKYKKSVADLKEELQSSLSPQLYELNDLNTYFEFVKKNGTWKEILPIQGRENQIYSYEEGKSVSVRICNLNNYTIFFSIYSDNGSGKFIKIYPPDYSLGKIESNSSNESISDQGELPKSAHYVVLTLGTTFINSPKETPLPSVHTFKLYITRTDKFIEDRPYKVLTKQIEVYPKNRPPTDNIS